MGLAIADGGFGHMNANVGGQMLGEKDGLGACSGNSTFQGIEQLSHVSRPRI